VTLDPLFNYTLPRSTWYTNTFPQSPWKCIIGGVLQSIRHFCSDDGVSVSRLRDPTPPTCTSLSWCMYPSEIRHASVLSHAQDPPWAPGANRLKPHSVQRQSLAFSASFQATRYTSWLWCEQLTRPGQRIGVRFPGRFFLFTNSSRSALGPMRPPTQLVLGSSFLTSKEAGTWSWQLAHLLMHKGADRMEMHRHFPWDDAYQSAHRDFTFTSFQGSLPLSMEGLSERINCTVHERALIRWGEREKIIL
jgi:hypothetical protein